MFNTGWALNRIYKFVLKRLLGRILKNELDPEQLDVQLGNGTIELRNLLLNCDYLSEQLVGALNSHSERSLVRIFDMLGTSGCPPRKRTQTNVNVYVVQAQLPAVVVAGEVGCARGIIPWTALGSQSCSVELEDVVLTLAPRPGAVRQTPISESTPGDLPASNGWLGLADGSNDLGSYLGADDGIHVIAMLIEKASQRC
eukprot:513497-Prorocentrum_minimum.AAC.3